MLVPPPIESPAPEPTRLLVAETMPLNPVVPLTHVIAPKALAELPLLPHRDENTTTLPPVYWDIPPLPTESLAVDPVKVEISTPVGVYKRTAPALLATVLSYLLATATLPPNRTVTVPEPKESFVCGVA